MIFVTFNKTITTQNFLWYISLFPLVAPNNKLFDYKKHGGCVIYGLILLFFSIYIGLNWNNNSDNLENKGENLFFSIWGTNCAFFLVNCVIIKDILVSNKK
jgi:hypothetical protein